jgi:6-phosphogluconolactonase (cycloisomerase 2 family)
MPTYLTFASGNIAVPTTSRVATFATGSNPYSVAFYYNTADPANSFLFSADYSSTTISFHRLDPRPGGTSGTIPTTSRVATFATGSGPYSVAFYYNTADPANSFLFSADYGSNTISFHRLDPRPGGTSGTIPTTSRVATFATGSNPVSVAFYYNTADPANSFLFSADFNSSIISFHRLDPRPGGTSGTIPTTSRVATFATGSNPYSVAFHYNTADPVNSFLFSADYSSTTISFHRLDPRPGGTSGTIPTTSRVATFATGSNPYSVAFHYNTADPVNSFLFSADYSSTTISFHRLDPRPGGTSGTIPTTSRVATFATGSGPISVAFYYNTADPANSFLFSANYFDGGLSFYRLDPGRTYFSVAAAQLAPPTLPFPGLSKTASTPITLSTTLADYQLFAALRVGASLTTSGHPTERYNYGFVIGDSDFTGTFTESFAITGASTTITGNYRLTMASGTTLTLSGKATYSESFTLLSGSTLAIAQNTTLTGDLVLNSGTTVTRAAGATGNYTLTLPYSSGGITAGTGITIQGLAATLAVTSLPVGANVAAYNAAGTLLLSGVADSSGIVSTTYTGGTTTITVRARLAGQIPFEATATLTSAGLTIPVFMPLDPNYTP